MIDYSILEYPDLFQASVSECGASARGSALKGVNFMGNYTVG